MVFTWTCWQVEQSHTRREVQRTASTRAVMVVPAAGEVEPQQDGVWLQHIEDRLLLSGGIPLEQSMPEKGEG